MIIMFRKIRGKTDQCSYLLLQNKIQRKIDLLSLTERSDFLLNTSAAKVAFCRHLKE